MKKIALYIFSVTLCNFLLAQNEVDALRYSQLTVGSSTARSSSMAGAFGALGADFSSLSINPAGIGLYRRNELVFTTGVYDQQNKASYNNFDKNDGKTSLHINNGGLILNYPFQQSNPNVNSKWVSATLGIGYNRLANFNNRFSIDGDNTKNSLADIYLRNAEGAPVSELSQFSEGLAFNTYLIDTVKKANGGDGTKYFSAIPHAGTNQTKVIESTGRLGETVISFGANYNNRLYIGVSLGFSYITYSEDAKHEEKDKKDTIPFFKSFNVVNKFTTTGSGFNIKIGAIYRVAEWVRLGLAFHSPTTYILQDNYTTTMSSYYDSGNFYTSSSPAGSFDYNLTTPMRFIGSAGFTIFDKGAISIDYEWLNYSSANLSADVETFSDANNQIQKKYNSAANIRIGAEYNMNPFFIRAGYAINGNPYKSGVNIDAQRTNITGGFGYRYKWFGIDVAYVYTKYAENYYLYDPTGIDLSPAKNNFQSSNFIITLGARF